MPPTVIGVRIDLGVLTDQVCLIPTTETPLDLQLRPALEALHGKHIALVLRAEPDEGLAATLKKQGIAEIVVRADPADVSEAIFYVTELFNRDAVIALTTPEESPEGVIAALDGATSKEQFDTFVGVLDGGQFTLHTYNRPPAGGAPATNEN